MIGSYFVHPTVETEEYENKGIFAIKKILRIIN